MNIAEMIRELQEEKQRLDEAIYALEMLARGGKRRRGRPPKFAVSHFAASRHSVRQALNGTESGSKPKLRAAG